VDKSPANMDALLEPLLSAADEEQADACLLQLITTHAVPVVKGVVRCKLHLNPFDAAEQSEADDIQQEVALQLLAELRKLRREPRAHPIGDVRGLAAVIAHRACARWMRRRFPKRHAFKNRLYYLLTRQRGFALWQNEQGRLTAGFAAWRGRGAVAAGRLKSLSGDERLLARIMSLQTGGRQSGAGDCIAAVFNHLGGPVEFDELVGTLAGLLGIRDRPVESTEENEDAVASESASILTFVWSRLAGATGYTVEVYDEPFNLVANSPRLAGNSWASPPLKRGGTYSWQVKAVKDGREVISPRPPAAQAKFRVLDAARADELRRARRAYASSHLTLGLLAVRARRLVGRGRTGIPRAAKSQPGFGRGAKAFE
jgi:hypothetical protein